VRVMVVGATGTVGTAVCELLEPGHEVVRASRRGDARVDLDDRDSIAALADGLRGVDAIVCCAASAPLTPLLDGDFIPSLQAKLLGQVELARTAIAHLPDGGSVTLTSGRIPEATPGSAGGALVNAGLEAFVRAGAVELHRGLRLNAVCPGWVRESLVALGMDPSTGTPAREIAAHYVEAVESTLNGQVLG